MRQAIETKYCGPTNSRGARVRVAAESGTKFVPWDHALNSTENHTRAAEQFASERGWLKNARLVGGGNAKGTGFVFVVVED